MCFGDVSLSLKSDDNHRGSVAKKRANLKVIGFGQNRIKITLIERIIGYIGRNSMIFFPLRSTYKNEASELVPPKRPPVHLGFSQSTYLGLRFT